ncbi:MAG: adenine deaminase C-terminal domain-containing protein [Desulfobacterales bacterium]|nr:adenine deaminase C-terminal domain-containing protein [Desulfobacterales bacterium]
MSEFELVEVASIEDTKALMNVVLGREKADLAVINARLMNVYTGEILDHFSVCSLGRRIAYVGNKPKEVIGEKTTVIDAAGQTLIPGLIDGHAHLGWLFNACEFLNHAMAGGTTTIITESMEPFAAGGRDAVLDFLASLKDQPIKIFATVSPNVSISRKSRGISIGNLEELLGRSDILGLGETYWQAVLQEPDLMLPFFYETLKKGKKLEGHSAGAAKNKLMAYVAAGISSCHEPINMKEVLERLRLGLYVMIREGSVRRDLEAISEIRNHGLNLRRLVLVSDGISPKDILEKGYMEFIVQKAIDCGFDPITAIQMATLNVAEHFSLDHVIGGIAPGRDADWLVIPDERTIAPRYVISKGRIIARDGKLLVPARKHNFSETSLRSVRLPEKLKASHFIIHTQDHDCQAEVRIIDLVTDLVTRESRLTLPVVTGEIRADVDRNVLKVAAIDRTHIPGKMFVGLVRGFCLRSGAVAATSAWDSSDIVVVGATDADMATAVNRVRDLDGGIVACRDGKILTEVPLPIFGLLSEKPMETLAREMDGLKKVLSDLGAPFPDPFLTLGTLTCAAIPYFRICEEGYVDFKSGQSLGVLV